MQVKADGQILVSEGHSKMKEINSSSNRSFRQCFTFPTLVNIEAVTSTLSSSEVLTITTSKKRDISTAEAEEHREEESRNPTSPKKVSGNLSTITRHSAKTTSRWTK
ncbi:uncharacterized protein LOC143037506 isoform X1 [Oratosquilla oratoria]|uniref:uncharacterized protein LOC143037506 isoform X1 n=1 Tax=Oratosquilla oratoria TaxID=337810 RepID=UPI003F76CD26